jgi:CRISPR-associated protein Cas8b/Csh1 subtype I-B
MFLLGALVGKVSAYQVGVEDLGKTLAHSVEKRGITRRHVNKIVNDVYHYDTVYSGKEGQPLYWQDLLRRLTASYSQVGDPVDWSLNTDEIETWYAFGHVFGGSLPSDGDPTEEEEREGKTETEATVAPTNEEGR